MENQGPPPWHAYSAWGIAVLSQNSTHLPPETSRRIVRFEDTTTIIPRHHINPKIPIRGVARLLKELQEDNDPNHQPVNHSNSLKYVKGRSNAALAYLRSRADESNVHWTPDEMRTMKLVNMVEMRMELELGGWASAPEEKDMTRCMTCSRSIHPAHHLVETTTDVFGLERHAECESCFYSREERDLPPLKKRNLRQIMFEKEEAERSKKKREDELERLRALPPPEPPLWQKVLKSLTGIDIAKLCPLLFGFAADPALWLSNEEGDGDAWAVEQELNNASHVKTRWAGSKFKTSTKPAGILKSHRGQRAALRSSARRLGSTGAGNGSRSRTNSVAQPVQREPRDPPPLPRGVGESRGLPPSIKLWANGAGGGEAFSSGGGCEGDGGGGGGGGGGSSVRVGGDGKPQNTVRPLQSKRSVESRVFVRFGAEGHEDTTAVPSSSPSLKDTQKYPSIDRGVEEGE